MDVLITNASGKKALAVVRSLGKMGISIVTSDSVRISASFYSRYSTYHFIYPPIEKTKPFINSLRHYIRMKSINVLMPIAKETYVIAKYKEKFDTVKIPIPEYKKLQKANNKRSLMDFAAKIGIPVPHTYVINDITKVKDIARVVEFPVVIKPVEGEGARGVRYIHTKDELVPEYNRVVQKFNLTSSEYPLIQEYIPGTGYGVSMLFNNGDPRAIFTHRRLREFPITGGSSTARISVRHSKMEKYATKLLKELDWHGVAMVEFKLDDRTKKPVLMEINPRFWGSIYQAISSGVDFPCMLYKMAVEGDVKPIFDYKVGVKTRQLRGDFHALLAYLRSKEKNTDKFKDFFNFFEHNLYYEDLNFKDPLPTIIQPVSGLLSKLYR